MRCCSSLEGKEAGKDGEGKGGESENGVLGVEEGGEGVPEAQGGE